MTKSAAGSNWRRWIVGSLDRWIIGVYLILPDQTSIEPAARAAIPIESDGRRSSNARRGGPIGSAIFEIVFRPPGAPFFDRRQRGYPTDRRPQKFFIFNFLGVFPNTPLIPLSI